MSMSELGLREYFLKKDRIQNWITSSSQMGTDIQIQQSCFRLAFASAGLLYLWLHNDFSSLYTNIFILTTIAYFIYNAFIILVIQYHPLSSFRLFISPLFDITVVAMAMLVDTGQSSGLYLMFFIIIFGNGLRFGNPMLLYSQAISILGLNIVAIVTLIDFKIDLDMPLLVLQNIALLALPAYTYLIGKHSDHAIKRQKQAERTTFGLLDHGPLPAFTYLLDKQGAPRIQFTNHAMQHVYRDDVMNLIGEQVDIVAIMEDGNEIIHACQSVFNDPEDQASLRFYIRGCSLDGSILQLMGQVICLPWKDRQIGVCYLIDMTQNETLRSGMAETMHEGFMSTLVAGVVHDFRNVLTGMIGTAEVLKFTTEDKQSQQQLDLIMDAGDRGAELITNLLEMNKKTASHSKNKATEHHLQQSLSSILDLVRIQLPQHIQLHVNISETLPNINISATQVEQIIINLINNATYAIKESGMIHVTLSPTEMTLASGKSMEACLIHIQDNGQGIAKDDLEFISKPFWTSHKEDGGTGLGLTMVQRIIRQHAGSFDITSTVGEGTDIRIMIPASIEHDVIHHPAIAQKKSTKTLNPCTILLVDDSPEVRHVHQQQLEKMGHQVHVTENGTEALKYFNGNKNSIDMVITDFLMPSMDGLDLSIAIRKKNKHIPILIITAYGDDDQLQQAHAHNIHLIAKPVSYLTFADKIISIQNSASTEPIAKL